MATEKRAYKWRTRNLGNLCRGLCASDWFKSRTPIWLDLGMDAAEVGEKKKGGGLGFHASPYFPFGEFQLSLRTGA
jgi:hypothetical protein